MKRLLGLTLALASLGVFGIASDAKAAELSQNSATVAASSSPQWQRDRDRDRYGRRVYNDRWRGRTVTRSRIVRYGRRLYRETYLVRVRPNGRTDTRLISRVQVG
jgi:hypothetical protein